MIGLGKGYDGRNFRFRFPFFPFSCTHILSFPPCNCLNNLPQLHVWDIILDFSLFNTVCSQLSSVIKTEGIFFFLSFRDSIVFLSI